MSQPESKQPAIEIKNISKKFIIPKYNRNSLKEVVVNGLFKNEKTEHQVLDDISFTIEKGDFFGIVGRNGSGKSTLLKLICGIYAPDAGEIKLHGKLTPFIELGVGFNPELSGRDNVYLNGALLGFTRPQMEAMYDEIVEFAELEEFMDLKLKNYSSGMQVRLAFSIAIKAKNDILIFDEVLAVGDAAFQEKCLRQFNQFKKEGRTVVLVTHSMAQVEKFCNRAILIEDGKKAYDGEPVKVSDLYTILNMTGSLSSSSKKEDTGVAMSEQEVAVIKRVNIYNSSGKLDNPIMPGESIDVELEINASKPLKDVFLAVRLCESQSQIIVAGYDNNEAGFKLNLKRGLNIVKTKIKKNPLIAGKFYVLAGLYESEKRKDKYAFYSGINNNNIFLVKGEKGKFGLVSIFAEWK